MANSFNSSGVRIPVAVGDNCLGFVGRVFLGIGPPSLAGVVSDVVVVVI